MAYDATPIPADDSHLDGVRRLAERVERKQDWFNGLVRQAKGGNPNKLVSARDCHAHAFAAISASLTKRED